MGIASKTLSGKAENSRIAQKIKEKIKLNIIDIFFAFFLIYFSYKGFRKGFMLSLIGFCSIFLSIIIALNYSHIISGILFGFFPTSEKLALGFISIVLTFFVSTFLIHKVKSNKIYFRYDARRCDR